MPGENAFTARIFQAVSALGVSQKEFAEKIEISRSYMSELVNGRRTAISPALADKIQNVWGISRQWLENGAGEMFIPKPGPEIPEKPVDEASLAGADAAMYDYVYVPILAVEAAAGLPMSVDQEHVIDTAVIHRRRLGRGRYVCVTIKGDSMTPILKDGYLCAINLDRTDPERLRGQIVAAYVFGGLTIKWLSFNHGQYMLVPENREYAPIYFDAKDARIVGAVEWWEGGPDL